MDEEQIAPVVEEIKEALPDVDEDRVREELKRYLQYGIVIQEAKRAILRKFGGGAPNFSPAGHKRLDELKGNEANVDITVKCIASRERLQKTSNGEKTMISGLVADDAMIKRFVSWEGQYLEKGKVYEIKGCSAKIYRGEVEIILGSYTNVAEAEGSKLEGLDTSKLPRFGTLVEATLREVRRGMGNLQITAKVLGAEPRTIETETGKKMIIDGILADDTQRLRYTAWHDFGLEIGDVVRIRGAYVKEWRGIPQINFDERAEVEKVEGIDFDVAKTPRLLAEELMDTGASDVEVLGTIIEVREGSGLIFRCLDCNRALVVGSCSIHGPQEGKPDLRAKVILDDGTGALFVVLNTEITEEVLGMGVDKCVEKYGEQETGEIVSMLNRKLLGQDYLMRGNVIRDDFGSTMLPSAITIEEGDCLEEAKELLKDRGVN